MAKKQENFRLTKEELTNLQTLVKVINQVQLQIGGLEVQKSLAIERINKFQADVGDLQNKFRKKYGDVTININDGTLSQKEDEVNKED